MRWVRLRIFPWQMLLHLRNGIKQCIISTMTWSLSLVKVPLRSRHSALNLESKHCFWVASTLSAAVNTLSSANPEYPVIYLAFQTVQDLARTEVSFLKNYKDEVTPVIECIFR